MTQIAEVTINLHSIPRSIERLHGSIEIATSRGSLLRIPFDEKIYHGALDWKSEETEIFLFNQTEGKHCQSVRVYNRFQTIISVHRLTIDKFDLLSQFVQVDTFFLL